MSLKILIVEDQFIEANDLLIILEKAGHSVCGIAKSVVQALDILTTEKPEIVLLDIFLQDSLTGIDLAKMLSKENIPFIYISANSDPSTFEAAKATQPYGFLIKPFREMDILVALDIAVYRHQHAVELTLKESRRLSGELTDIAAATDNFEQKLLLLIKAFKAFIPFDHVIIDMDTSGNNLLNCHSFHRIAFDEYTCFAGKEIVNELDLAAENFSVSGNNYVDHSYLTFLNSEEFAQSCIENKISYRLKEKYDLNSCMRISLPHEEKSESSLFFYSSEAECYGAEQTALLNPLRTLLSSIIGKISTQKDSARTIKEENTSLYQKNSKSEFNGIIGNSPKLLQALDLVNQVANFDTSVLILGETGVGKEGLVIAIHKLSSRSSGPLIKINCGAIPGSLIESELFGYEKGAFTGAFERRIGKFEQAQGGTIFLDEIGEMPLETQSKLLRVIQEKELERIGGRTTVKLDIRIIAATNRNLYKEVAAGKFRVDLYYRINVFSITLPALRERPEDIPLLVDHFLKKYALASGKPLKKISRQALQKFTNCPWPGNIRELENLVERQIILTQANLITSVEFPEDQRGDKKTEPGDQQFNSMAEIDKAYILAALKKSNGKVSGKGGAAEALNLPSTTLVSKMKKLGIVWKYISN